MFEVCAFLRPGSAAVSLGRPRMYNGPTGAGTMTSGGTESIIMAVKAYRDWALDTKGITEPEM